MQRERISIDPGQSFRFFSWKGDIDHILLQRSDGPPVEVSGLGNRWHFHPELELTFITKGEGLRFVGDDVAHFSAPDLVLIGSDLPHYWKTKKSSGYCIQFEFGPNAPLMAVRENRVLAPLIRRAARGLVYSPGVCDDVERLLKACMNVSPMIRLANLLLVLERLGQARPKPLSSTKSFVSEKQSVAIQLAVQYIIDHASEDTLQLQDVLDHVRLSRATFSRHFHLSVGQSYTHFLQNMRLEHARRLLITTETSITEIAFASGFGNLSHFNTLFRRRWLMTPRELRHTLGE